MSEKDFKLLMELAERRLREKVSREEAIRSLMRIGLVDAEGNLTKEYECLAGILGRK